MADNTIIVYSADNGYYMGNRGLAGKWAHHDESLRVPMIVMDPRVSSSQRGKVSDAFALNLDLPSTFLDWANVEIPERYQGHSLEPIVSGDTPTDWRKETFHEHFAVRFRIPAFEGVRNKNFKYVRYVDHANHEFLHDLKNDPNELINLAYDPKHAETLATLRKSTDNRVANYGGPLLTPRQKFTLSTPPHPEASALVSFRANKDGFVPLLNNRNLGNWEGDRKYWSLTNGVLTGTTDGWGTEWHTTSDRRGDEEFITGARHDTQWHGVGEHVYDDSVGMAPMVTVRQVREHRINSIG